MNLSKILVLILTAIITFMAIQLYIDYQILVQHNSIHELIEMNTK